jgi:hypothetical protein
VSALFLFSCVCCNLVRMRTLLARGSVPGRGVTGSG